jgi:hypothetical protein
VTLSTSGCHLDPIHFQAGNRRPVRDTWVLVPSFSWRVSASRGGQVRTTGRSAYRNQTQAVWRAKAGVLADERQGFHQVGCATPNSHADLSRGWGPGCCVAPHPLNPLLARRQKSWPRAQSAAGVFAQPLGEGVWAVRSGRQALSI